MIFQAPTQDITTHMQASVIPSLQGTLYIEESILEASTTSPSSQESLEEVVTVATVNTSLLCR